MTILAQRIDSMIAVFIACGLILYGLLANYIVYGKGCWGFQPGGSNSSVLYASSFVCLLLAVFRFFKVSYTTKDWRRKKGSAVFFVLGFVVLLHLKFGWRISSSLHGMGNENLLPFMGVLMAFIVVSYVDRH